MVRDLHGQKMPLALSCSASPHPGKLFFYRCAVSLFWGAGVAGSFLRSLLRDSALIHSLCSPRKEVQMIVFKGAGGRRDLVEVKSIPLKPVCNLRKVFGCFLKSLSSSSQSYQPSNKVLPPLTASHSSFHPVSPTCLGIHHASPASQRKTRR